MTDKGVRQTHHWPDEETPPGPTTKRSRLARFGIQIGDAIETAGIGGAMGSHLPNVGQNPLVNQRVVTEKINPKTARE